MKIAGERRLVACRLRLFISGDMMKYYVRSHNLRVVIAGDYLGTPEDAACEAFLVGYNKNVIVSPLIIVSERGFDYDDHEHYEDVILNTDLIMKKAGLQ